VDSNARKKRIETTLINAFDPISIEVRDDSKLHAGHQNIEEGAKETHFYINMVSLSFRGLSKVMMHREVYDLLKDEFVMGLHALELELRSN
jgi:BolA protein